MEIGTQIDQIDGEINKIQRENCSHCHSNECYRCSQHLQIANLQQQRIKEYRKIGKQQCHFEQR